MKIKDLSKEDLVKLGVKLFKEIIKRKRKGDMKYTIHPEAGSKAYKKLWKEVEKHLTKEEVRILTTKCEDLKVVDFNQVLENPLLIAEISDTNLNKIHNEAHSKLEEGGFTSKEQIWNLHQLIVQEMKSRGIKHDTPVCRKKLTSEKIVKVIKNIGDRKIIFDFASLVGSAVESKKMPNDIDIVLRMEDPIRFGEYVKRAVAASLSKELRKQGITQRIHAFTESPGPHSDHLPIWDLALVRRKRKIIKHEKLQEFPYSPQKPNDEFSYDKNNVIKAMKFDKTPYSIEKKVNGFHIVVKKEKEEVQVYSEEKKKIKGLNKFLDRIKKLSDKDFIIDGELIWTKDLRRSRRALMKFLKDKKAPSDESVGAVFWDIIQFNGKNLTDLTLKERAKFLERLNFEKDKNLKIVPRKIAKSKKEARKFVNEMSKKEASEGAVVKALDSKYRMGSESKDWMKYRLTRTFKGRIIKRNRTKGGNCNYTYGVDLTKNQQKLIKEKFQTEVKGKVLHNLGNTFVTTVCDGKPGDIIEVRAETVWRHEFADNKIKYSIHKPRFEGLRPDIDSTSSIIHLDNIVSSLGIAVKEEKESLKEKPPKGEGEEEIPTRKEAAQKFWKENWHNLFNKNGKGKFILHGHARGLSKEESEWSLEKLIEQGKRSYHTDLRLGINTKDFPKAFYGITIFEGSLKDVPKETKSKLIYMAKHPDSEKIEKLQCTTKNLGPEAWLHYAVDKPKIHGPGEIGATEEKYAKFWTLDKGNYEQGVMHKHLIELRMKGKELNGRLVAMKAPIGGKRIWLIDFFKDSEYIAEKKTLDKQVKELKESKTDHKWLIWAKPGEKPKKIDVKKYKIKEKSLTKEEWIVDQIAEKLIAQPLWSKKIKINKEPKAIGVNKSGKFTIQKHTIKGKTHHDLRLERSSDVASFTIKGMDSLPKSLQPKVFLDLDGRMPIKKKHLQELVGSFEIVSKGEYGKEKNRVFLQENGETIGLLDLKRNKVILECI